MQRCAHADSEVHTLCACRPGSAHVVHTHTRKSTCCGQADPEVHMLCACRPGSAHVVHTQTRKSTCCGQADPEVHMLCARRPGNPYTSLHFLDDDVLHYLITITLSCNVAARWLGNPASENTVSTTLLKMKYTYDFVYTYRQRHSFSYHLKFCSV